MRVEEEAREEEYEENVEVGIDGKKVAPVRDQKRWKRDE